MDSSAFCFALTGVVPATCDAEAGEADRLVVDHANRQPAHPRPDPESWWNARIGATCESN